MSGALTRTEKLLGTWLEGLIVSLRLNPIDKIWDWVGISPLDLVGKGCGIFCLLLYYIVYSSKKHLNIF